MKTHKYSSKTAFFGIALLGFVALFSSLFSYCIWSNMQDPSYPNSEMSVYITYEGKKYHTFGCSYLHGGYRQTSISRAIENGYSRCSKCEPPTLISESEYIQRKENQPIFLIIIMGFLFSGPLTLAVLFFIAKINDFLGFLHNFPDSFLILLTIVIYASICVQYFRICIIW